MAMLSENQTSISSNCRRSSSAESSGRRSATTNTTASAYVVNAATMDLTAYQYSTCGAGVLTSSQEWGGAFEVASGNLSPPPSPRVAAKDYNSTSQPQQLQRQPSRSGDAAYHITEECERLFCETLRTAFLVEKNAGAARNSLVMGAPEKGLTVGSEVDLSKENTPPYEYGRAVGMPVQQQRQQRQRQTSLPTPAPSPGTAEYPSSVRSGGMIREYLEVYDYHSSGVRFRSFVAEQGVSRALFVFFDSEVMEQDLKPGLTSLLELAGTDGIDCDQLIVCLDRNAEGCKDLAKDLGWVGLEIAMLDTWSGHECTLSDRWLFLSMDV